MSVEVRQEIMERLAEWKKTKRWNTPLMLDVVMENQDRVRGRDRMEEFPEELIEKLKDFNSLARLFSRTIWEKGLQKKVNEASNSGWLGEPPGIGGRILIFTMAGRTLITVSDSKKSENSISFIGAPDEDVRPCSLQSVIGDPDKVVPIVIRLLNVGIHGMDLRPDDEVFFG